jgi:PucR C-terminal helix-turn-helix domain/GGDEF-like domain
MRSEGWVSRPVPSEAISIVREEVPALVDEIIAAVRAENPDYDEFLGGPEGMGIRLGVEQAVRAFLDAAESGARPAGETGEVWKQLGEAEFQSGRALESLRTAFRTGTRAAWRGAAELAASAGVAAPVVIALAEAIFVYTDELAGDVVEGYIRAQSDEAGERERRRRRLAALLLDPAGHDPDTIERAAALAGWPLPKTLAVGMITSESPVTLPGRVDVDVLAGVDADGTWLIVPDPDGPRRARSLTRAARDLNASVALGPTVPPADAPRSHRWARSTLHLIERGAIPAAPLTRAGEHLASLIVHQDPELAASLATARLGALDELRPSERDRLLETLAAWLGYQTHTPKIAAVLNVHPQTVRYRVRQLHELLGDALDTPEGRFELLLALRARAGASAEQSQDSRGSSP